jgi:hypothetical protein
VPTIALRGIPTISDGKSPVKRQTFYLRGRMELGRVISDVHESKLMVLKRSYTKAILTLWISLAYNIPE